MANTFKSPLQKAVVTWLTAHPDVTIAELSRRAGTDKGDLSKINSGQKHSLNMESAVRLARALGTTVEGLIGETPAQNAVRSDVDVGARFIPLADIDPSPDNPRKEFEEESLAQLAASIAEQGLLQPIVVRPKGERFEIVAGERRYRALKLNEATEALCLVRQGDDEATTRALRIIENLQRADIKPIEEADAFLALAELDPKKWNATTIGKAIGMSDRFVAQRISIARNLAPDLKEKLKEGGLKIEIARLLAAWPQQLQSQVTIHDWYTPGHIRRDLEGMVVPVSRAAFDRTLYTGEIVDHDGEEHFADKALFLRLQDEAAAALASSLAKDWPGARFALKNARTGAYVWADNGDPIHRWTEDREPTTWHPGLTRADVTAVVYVDDNNHAVVALKGVVPRETFAAKAQKSDEQRAREAEAEQEDQLDREVKSATRDFREQLLDQMPAHPKLAQMLFIYGAIGQLGHGLYVETNPSEYLGPWKDQLAGILEMNDHGWEPYDAPADGEDKLWSWLVKLGREQVDQMFCRLMAVQIAIGRFTPPGVPHHFAYKALGLEIPEALQRAHAARSDDEDEDDGLEDDVDGTFDTEEAEAA
jgi:ParB/RepB/Spo0J family partition protein